MVRLKTVVRNEESGRSFATAWSGRASERESEYMDWMYSSTLVPCESVTETPLLRSYVNVWSDSAQSTGIFFLASRNAPPHGNFKILDKIKIESLLWNIFCSINPKPQAFHD
jgi:hypothetical protein